MASVLKAAYIKQKNWRQLEEQLYSIVDFKTSVESKDLTTYWRTAVNTLDFKTSVESKVLTTYWRAAVSL